MVNTAYIVSYSYLASLLEGIIYKLGSKSKVFTDTVRML